MITPEYPRTSKLAKHQGVAVAELETNTRGEVESVEILEAPDADVGRSLERALRKWRLSPLTINKEPCRIRGKVTYYYRLVQDVGRVLPPADAAALHERK